MKARMPVTKEELERRSDSVLRVIRETPGLSAQMIGCRLGEVPAREVRERIRLLRQRGLRVVIGADYQGYYDLDGIADPQTRAELVKLHMARTKCYLSDHATLCRQIGAMSASAVGEWALFNIVVPDDPATGDRQLGIDELARIPIERRKGLFQVFMRYMDRLANDPEAFSYERTFIADRYRGMFISKAQADKIAQARKLLEEATA